MKHLAILALGLGHAACSSKPATKKPDCEAYATRYAELIGADPSRRDTVLQGARRACANGRVTAAQIQCVEDASSADAVRACMGLAPEPAPSEGSSVTSAPAKNSKTTIVGADGAGVKPAAERSKEEAQWIEELGQRLSRFCDPIAVPVSPPRAFDVIVTFGADAATIDVSKAPEPLHSCLSRQLDVKPPSGTEVRYNEPVTFHLTVDAP